MANKLLKCKWCKQFKHNKGFIRTRKGNFCTYEHAILFVNKVKEKASIRDRNKIKREDKKKWNHRKSEHKLSDIQYQHKLTQPIFNKMRKLEELQWFSERCLEPVCISCLKPLGNDQWCNGHFKTVGSNGALRYDRKNSYLQHNFHCNMNKSGDITGYKEGLVSRFGEIEGNEIIDYCDNHERVKKYTGQELQKMRKYFSFRIRALEMITPNA